MPRRHPHHQYPPYPPPSNQAYYQPQPYPSYPTYNTTNYHGPPSFHPPPPNAELYYPRPSSISEADDPWSPSAKNAYDHCQRKLWNRSMKHYKRETMHSHPQPPPWIPSSSSSSSSSSSIQARPTSFENRMSSFPNYRDQHRIPEQSWNSAHDPPTHWSPIGQKLKSFLSQPSRPLRNSFVAPKHTSYRKHGRYEGLGFIEPSDPSLQWVSVPHSPSLYTVVPLFENEYVFPAPLNILQLYFVRFVRGGFLINSSETSHMPLDECMTQMFLDSPKNEEATTRVYEVKDSWEDEFDEEFEVNTGLENFQGNIDDEEEENEVEEDFFDDIQDMNEDDPCKIGDEKEESSWALGLHPVPQRVERMTEVEPEELEVENDRLEHEEEEEEEEEVEIILNNRYYNTSLTPQDLAYFGVSKSEFEYDEVVDFDLPEDMEEEEYVDEVEGGETYSSSSWKPETTTERNPHQKRKVVHPMINAPIDSGEEDLSDEVSISNAEFLQGFGNAFNTFDMDLEMPMSKKDKRKLKKLENAPMSVVASTYKSLKEKQKKLSSSSYTLHDLDDVIQEFINLQDRQEILIDSQPKQLRVTIHELARTYRLKTVSHGKGKFKQVALIKTKHSCFPDPTTSLYAKRARLLNLPFDSSLTTTKHKSKKSNTETAAPISSDNIGHKILQGLGWTPGASIGLKNSGIQMPLTAVKRKNRLGLGN
ncbi:hypothetical protein HMI54_013166 [Coelomomyces lativittatus]|nr:hypothetical protein HMI56_000653 [Coelomomyces lativittatus]KAJ1514950.1 hypothetical protein HMI54_013166 [Coelomomyces lativittatus]KAJ1517166.1 hypothetical protein HMI55_000471 [Coelomomyces lativittatus]